MRRRFPRVTEHGSLVEAQIADDQLPVGEKYISPEMARLYVHPGLLSLPDPVPNLSGVDKAALQAKHSKSEPADPENGLDISAIAQDAYGIVDAGPSLLSLRSDVTVYVDARDT
jgi:hypothetical protein